MPELLIPKTEQKSEEQRHKEVLAAHLRDAIAVLRDTEYETAVENIIADYLGQIPETIEVLDELPSSNYDDALQEVRNLIVSYKSNPEEFAASLRELPDDPESLGEYVRESLRKPTLTGTDGEIDRPMLPKEEAGRREGFIDLICGMGVTSVGAYEGRKKSMESILELKRHFNFETNRFE